MGRRPRSARATRITRASSSKRHPNVSLSRVWVQGIAVLEIAYFVLIAVSPVVDLLLLANKPAG